MSSILERLEPPGPQLDGSVILRLDDDDWVNSWAAGARRVTENMRKRDSLDYQNGLNAPEHIAQPLSVMCEVAVARHLGIEWDWAKAWWRAEDHHKYRHQPDVGANIEVRRVRRLTSPVSLRANQVNKGLVLYAAYAMPPEFFNIKIIGAMPYDLAWEQASPAVYAGKASATKRSLPLDALWKCRCMYQPGCHPG